MVIHLSEYFADSLRICLPYLHILHMDAIDASLAKRKVLVGNHESIVDLTEKLTGRLVKWAQLLEKAGDCRGQASVMWCKRRLEAQCQEHGQPLRRARDGVRRPARHAGFGDVRDDGGAENGGDADEDERAEAQGVLLRLQVETGESRGQGLSSGVVTGLLPEFYSSQDRPAGLWQRRSDWQGKMRYTVLDRGWVGSTDWHGRIG